MSPRLSLGNGVTITGADLFWHTPDELWLTVYWKAERSDLEDYSVAVHLVKKDPPSGPDDILAQADQVHPVRGRYPLSLWEANEVVRDVYRLKVPAETEPTAVRVNMYQALADGTFNNTDWLSLPVPAQPTSPEVEQ
jgi:hypothetical protein